MTKNDEIIYQTTITENDEQKELEFREIDNIQNQKSIHGLYPYRGKMSPKDARQIIKQLPHEGTLLDPFCGSGTIVYEAQKWGLESIGVDRNPLAATVAKAKTTPIENKEKIIHEVKDIVKEAKALDSPKKMNEWPRKYFHEKTASQIMRVYNFFDQMNDYQKGAFYGAIALAARGCNHYKWSSNSTGKNITPHKEINFYEKLLYKVKKHLPYVSKNDISKIYERDTKNITDFVPKESVDYIYSSPPYFDALDYTSYYARIIYEIENRSRGQIRDDLIQNYSTYEEEMKEVMKVLKNVLKKDGLMIFVVGDKKKGEKLIRGGEFFKNLTDWRPEYIKQRGYGNSASQIWDDINETEREEQLVVWEKSS